MKSFIRKNRPLIAYIIISIIVAVAGIVTAPGNELLYMLLGQYIIFPVAGFICSISSAKKGTVLGFLSPFIFTAVAVLLPFLIFGATDIVFLIFGGVPCALGLVFGFIGYLISRSRRASVDEKKEKKEIKEEKLKDIEEARAENEDFSVGADDINSSEANAPEEEEAEEAEEALAEA